MNKKKIFVTLLCVLLIDLSSSNVVNAAATEKYSQSQAVSGGKINSYATYYDSGSTRWSYSWSCTLNNYTNVKSSYVATTREWMDEYELIVGGQIVKLDYNYVTTKLGSHEFFYSRG